MQAAAVIHAGECLGLTNGVVIAVPNTVAAAEGEAVNTAILQALSEANAAGIQGWRITPFLLKVMSMLSRCICL